MTGRSLLALCLAVLLGSPALGCSTHAPAALAVDTPLVPYEAPDIDELTGEDLSIEEDPEVSETSETPAPAAAPQPTTKPPAVPAKTGT